ncbi:MAG: Smr/MutS family protein [Pseudomonadota bacterium]
MPPPAPALDPATKPEKAPKRRENERSEPKETFSTAKLEDRSNHREVRRGRMEVDGRIDLHGMTQAQADRALSSFLISRRAIGAKCVLVITGKGRGGEGVLRRNFIHWLETPAARGVLSGWAPAHARHGGSGAFYVYLRRLKS